MNNYDREFDQTQLKLAQFKYQPHKDYLGHVFRWGFASRFVNNTSTVLDVGCGQEQPFARSLGGASINTVPKLYVGCDLNKIKEPIGRKNFHTLDEFNFIRQWKEIAYHKFSKTFSLIVNFEVFEHMTMNHGRKMLKAIHELLDKKGIFIFSTPVYCSTYKQANNHINELTKEEMEKELHRAGFKIINQYGTFSNWNDIKKVATKDEIALKNSIAHFYGNEILGCFISPKYPEASRNITHVCVRGDNLLTEMELTPSIIKFNGEKPGVERNKK